MWHKTAPETPAPLGGAGTETARAARPTASEHPLPGAVLVL